MVVEVLTTDPSSSSSRYAEQLCRDNILLKIKRVIYNNHVLYKCCFQNVLMCPKICCKFHLLGGMEAEPSQWWTAISPRAVQMRKKGENSWSRMMSDEKRKFLIHFEAVTGL